MARKVLVRLVDDLDGSPSADVAPVTFALDGVTYQIDLNKANAGRLRESLAGFVANARRTSGRAKRGTAARAGRASTSGDVSAIRQWAKEQGYPVSARGRIPADILDAYNSANSGAGTSAAAATPNKTTARAAKAAAAKPAPRTTRAKTAAAAKTAPTATAKRTRTAAGKPAATKTPAAKATASKPAATRTRATKSTTAKPAAKATAAKTTAKTAAKPAAKSTPKAAAKAPRSATPRPRSAVARKAKG